MQVKKQQLELDMKQQTGSKSGKEYVKVVYYHPAYLTYMQNTSCKMLGWMKHKLESRLLRDLYVGQEATVRTGHGTTDWFQIRKGVVKAVYCHPAYLTYMQSTS